MRNESAYKQAYRRTIDGRAKIYLAYLTRRCRLKGHQFDLDLEWVIHRLQIGRCEVTGIPFDFESRPERNRSPWAFSIDRIDGSKGYTKSNSQAVVWAFNAAKGEGTDDDVYFLAKCLLGIIPLDERGTISALPFNGKVSRSVK